MNLTELRQHIVELAFVEESDAPVVNCCLNVGSRYRKAFNDQVRAVKSRIEPKMQAEFWEILGRIEVVLGTDLRSGTRGVAVFARGGTHPFFRPLQFGAPLPNRVTISRTPQLYPLVELRDNYYRYAVLLSTEESARILEIDVGTVKETFRIARPGLRRRDGREWTRDHLQSHTQARLQQFVHEQVRLLDQTVASGDYRHLVLAGDPRAIALVHKALPRHLRGIVIGTVRASDKDRSPDLEAATLAAFEAHRETESLSVVRQFGYEIGTRGPAVQGTVECFRALQGSNARTLILSQTYDPGPGYACRACNGILPERRPRACPACGRTDLRPIDIREEMVRMAERNRCAIEIVKSSGAMTPYGGVGCLLRYFTPELDRKPAA